MNMRFYMLSQPKHHKDIPAVVVGHFDTAEGQQKAEAKMTQYGIQSVTSDREPRRAQRFKVQISHSPNHK